MRLGAEFLSGRLCHFMDRRNFTSYRITLGLVQPKSHDQNDVFEATTEVLKRYGLSKGDVKFSINDTTNSAVAASQQISGGEEGTCMMHLINLVAEHAIGKRNRSVNKKKFALFQRWRICARKVAVQLGTFSAKKQKGASSCTPSAIRTSGSLSFDARLTKIQELVEPSACNA